MKALRRSSTVLLVYLLVQQVHAEDLKVVNEFFYLVSLLAVLAIIGVLVQVVIGRFSQRLWQKCSPEIKLYLRLGSLVGFLYVL